MSVFTSSTSGLLALLAMLCGAAAVVLGGLATAIKGKESSIAQAAYQNELSEKTNEITSLQAEINKLQNETINMITGGDSFPVINMLQSAADKEGLFTPEIWVSGKYPLRGFSAQITLKSDGETKKLNFREASLRPYTPTPIDLSINAAGEGASFLVARFFAENGTWHQKIEFRRTDDGQFQFSTVITRLDNPQTTILKKDYEENLSFGSLDEVLKSTDSEK